MKKNHRFHKRYAYVVVLALVAITLVACAGTPKSEDPAVAHAQVAMGDQQTLWQKKAGTPGMAKLQASPENVTVAKTVEVKAKPTARGEKKISPQVGTRVLMSRFPDQALGEKPLTTRGRVRGVEAATLAIEAPEGLVQLQTLLGGRTLALKEGDEVDVEIRRGTPFQRSDYLQVRGEKDALGYALVGGESPVKIELSFFNLTAKQEGPRRENNTMGVMVQVNDESQHFDKVGETLEFKTAGLFVQLLTSIAADEKTAAILPESHRLEIAVWPKPN